MGFGKWLVVGATLAAAAVGTARAQAVADHPAVVTPGDPVLADNVSGALAKDQALTLDNIQVSARNGVIELSGVVGNDFERSRAIRDAQGVAGVAAVDDNISIQPRDY